MPNFYPMNSISHQAIQGLHPCSYPSKVTFYISPHCSHYSNHTAFLGVEQFQLFLLCLPKKTTGQQKFLQNVLKHMLKCYLIRKDFAVSFNPLRREAFRLTFSFSFSSFDTFKCELQYQTH